MSLTASKVGPYFTSGSISFSELRSNFKETSSGSVSASELLRVTDTTNTDPIVPDATENSSIATSSNLKTSQFRNSIKYYNLNQGSGDTDLNLNIANSSLWNGNLGKTIVKTVTLAGTTGSTNGNAAASLDASAVYNVLLLITGSILGTGGSAGTETVNGGDGGHALYIDTNDTGTVTVRTSGASAQVYGGGGGGGGGGDGGTGGGGSYTQSGSRTVFKGNSGGQSGLGGGYGNMCQEACRRRFGGSAYCSVGCYLTPGQGGCGCPCWSNEGAGFAECNCCYANESYSNTINTSGGTGGQGTPGGSGQGYLQSRTFASSAPTLNQPGGPTSGGTNAGAGGRGGNGDDGGTWGQDGEDGDTGNTGINGNRTNGTAGTAGTLGGTAGRAVSGSNYIIDSNGIDSAYLGLK